MKSKTTSKTTRSDGTSATGSTPAEGEMNDAATRIAVTRIGARAVKVVERAAQGGPWTASAILRAAVALENGDRALGAGRPWPLLGARLRKIASGIDAPSTLGSMSAKPSVSETVAAKPPSTKRDHDDGSMATTDETAAAPHRDVLTLAELAKKYIAHLEARGASLGTRFSYDLDLKVAQRWFSADRDVRTITAEDIAGYNRSDAVVKTKLGAPKSEITTKKLRRTLRLCLVFAQQEGLVEAAPVEVSVTPTEGRDRKTEGSKTDD